ncbi:hypothetical protein T439DRAFT_379209 [Meredithblackwellia eburnea MCA 4105]
MVSIDTKNSKGTWTPSVASGLYNTLDADDDKKQVWLEFICNGKALRHSDNYAVKNPRKLGKCTWEGPMPAAAPGKGCSGLNAYGDQFHMWTDTTGNVCEPVNLGWSNKLRDIDMPQFASIGWKGIPITFKSYFGSKVADNGGNFSLNLLEGTGTYTPSVDVASTTKDVWFKLFCGDTAYAHTSGSKMLSVSNPKNLKKCPWEN